LAVIRVLLETHKLSVDQVEALAGFVQEVPQQLVHTRRLIAAGGFCTTGSCRACVSMSGAHGARRPRQARDA
jgi:glycerol-3-phosphate responsive antiterminator